MKKLIAPIIITVLLIMYFMFFVVVIAFTDDFSLIVKCIALVIPLALISVSVHVLFERIKEIRSGEEDDLSKY